MSERGFSLVELLIVIAIIGILLGIATIQFNRSMQKGHIENQVRTLYADLMDARSQAILQKQYRTIRVSATEFKIFPSDKAVGTPILERTLSFPVEKDVSDDITFDTLGMADVAVTICVQPDGNPGFIDSIAIGTTMIQMGKRSGGACDSAHFTAK